MGKTRSTSKSPKSASGATIEDVKATLRQLLEENAGIPADSLRDDSSIDGDLAMDSFSLLSVQVAIEEAFEVECELSDLEAQNRFDGIAALILERIEANQDPAPRPSLHGARNRSKTSRAKDA
jgi:acyl carrier protein